MRFDEKYRWKQTWEEGDDIDWEVLTKCHL